MIFWVSFSVFNIKVENRVVCSHSEILEREFYLLCSYLIVVELSKGDGLYFLIISIIPSNRWRWEGWGHESPGSRVSTYTAICLVMATLTLNQSGICSLDRDFQDNTWLSYLNLIMDMLPFYAANASLARPQTLPFSIRGLLISDIQKNLNNPQVTTCMQQFAFKLCQQFSNYRKLPSLILSLCLKS